MTAATGYFRFIGTSEFLSSSSGAWREIARLTASVSRARRRIPGTMPTVETVKLRAPILNPAGSWSRSTDAHQRS